VDGAEERIRHIQLTERIFGDERLPQLDDDRLQPRHILRLGDLREFEDGFPGQERPYAVDVFDFLLAELCDRRPAIGDELDQPLALENPKRFAKRRAADAQLFAQIRLDQFLPGPQIAGHDAAAQPPHAFIDDRGRLTRRNLWGNGQWNTSE